MSVSNSVLNITTIIRGLICDSSQIDGRDIFTAGTSIVFTLSESFIDSTSVQVFINNTLVPAIDWSFNSNTNAVTITSLLLDAGDIVMITYNYFAKYSDSEIKGFINSAFSYFVENRYKKVFIIDDSDNVVSLRGSNPSSEEIYFLAHITSILVDPQNSDMKVDGAFSSSKNRDKSDRQQIAEAFTRFQRFTGDITVDEIINHNNRDK